MRPALVYQKLIKVNTLKTERYEAILEEHKKEMDNLYTNGYYFQHNNSKAHKAAEIWMTGQGFDILDFPSYSPDLSPIENLWAALKNAVAKENPKTERTLCNSLIRN